MEESAYITDGIIEDLLDEVARGVELYGDYTSLAQAHAVIKSEFLELEEEFNKEDKDLDLVNMRSESIQVAAVCIRFVEELSNKMEREKVKLPIRNISREEDEVKSNIRKGIETFKSIIDLNYEQLELEILRKLSSKGIKGGTLVRDGILNFKEIYGGF